MQESILFDVTEQLLRNRTDVEISAYTDEYGERCLGHHGGPAYFSSDCIYDPVEDSIVAKLLSEWKQDLPGIDWSIHLELSKLLAKRGHVCREVAEHRVRWIADECAKLEFGALLHNQLWLSYLVNLPDGESLAVCLLDTVLEDFRDGLFHACYHLNTPAIYEAMKIAVRKWHEDHWMTGLGEQWQVLQMVQKWDKTFPSGQHEDIRQICEGNFQK